MPGILAFEQQSTTSRGLMTDQQVKEGVGGAQFMLYLVTSNKICLVSVNNL